MISDSRIDSGKAFDWGRTSEEYAKYRDIYPDIFYKKVADRGLCVDGQKVLEIATIGLIQFNPWFSQKVA